MPVILKEKLTGFDRAALQEGWRQHHAGEHNFEGAGQWLAWKKEGFIEQISQDRLKARKLYATFARA